MEISEVAKGAQVKNLVECTGTWVVNGKFGLSWRSPFGPILIDFAKALLKEDFDKTEVFRFDFGVKF